jgi:Ser-tRNA(Ala) deacylase AlaX
MTEMLYMQPDAPLEYETTVLEMPDSGTVILPVTAFYPQGGGQPSDQGMLTGAHGQFRVDKVQNIEGTVHLLGEITEGTLKPGDTVQCIVDTERRQVNTRIHSAGHVLDMAVKNLGYTWVPGKGYHFPDSPYVEYVGELPENIEELRALIEKEANNLISQDLSVNIEFMDRPEMEKRLPFVPEYLPTNRPARVVFMGEIGIPCGGTHVKHLKEIGKMEVTKLKLKSGNIRVGYQVREQL